MMSTPPGADDLARMRREYDHPALLEQSLAEDWHTQLARWFADAVAFGLPEPNAMIVATASPEGVPSGRTVLLKGFDEAGLVFFTNYDSRKGRELSANPRASLVFPWFAMHRQIVVCGDVSRVSRAESEAYFAQRPRSAQLGAWASTQSQRLDSPGELAQSYAAAAERFPGQVPVPPHWGGLRVRPETVEFWQGRPSRLHDRLVYRRAPDTNAGWRIDRLAP
jgi:pyridoxamine 5'-phosphate oxidase